MSIDQTRDADDVAKVMKSLSRIQRLGYRTFPLKPHAKTPLHKGWQDKDYSDFDWVSHFATGAGYGVLLGADDVVLDFDPRNGGDKTLESLEQYFDDVRSRYPHVITGSGGYHVYAKKDPAAVIVHQLAGHPGMDVQSAGRYVVGPGSLHPDTGKPYRRDGQWDQTVPHLSAVLMDLLRKPNKPAGDTSSSTSRGTPEKLAKMLAVLDVRNFADDDKWRAIAMSCKAYAGDEGLEVFAEWCDQDEAYGSTINPYNGLTHSETNRIRWDSMGVKGGVTAATLFAAVRDAGYPELVAQADYVDAADDFADEDDSSEGEPDALGAGLPTTIEQMDEALCVIQLQGKVKVLSYEPVETNDSRKLKVPVFSDQASIRLLLLNRKVSATVVNSDGEPTTSRKPLFDVWLGRKSRPTAVGFTMDPDGGRIVDGAYNLWQGYGIKPAPGDWSRLKAHVLNVLACGNEDEAAYILKWTAWVLQNPTRPAEVVLVLKGEKGTGKGEFLRLLCYIFGTHGMQISDAKHLVGNFNRHLQQTCFLFADEAYWPGDKGAEGQFKRLITEPTLTIEPKGIDAYEAPNRLSIAIASNESWVVPASNGERRFAPFEVSSQHAQDFDYFGALRAETYERGGAEAFLHDMLAMDLAGWHPRQDIPKTDAMRGQQAESAGLLDKWMGEILAEGELPAEVYVTTDRRRHRIVHRSDPALGKGAMLLEHAKLYMGRKPLSPHTFWSYLSNYGIAEIRLSGGGRWRRFPHLPELRAKFAKANPWWPNDGGAEGWTFADEPHEVRPTFRDFADEDGDSE